MVLAKTTASLYRFSVDHFGTPTFGLGDRLVVAFGPFLSLLIGVLLWAALSRI